MQKQATTRRRVLTLASGALVALAGCGGDGGADGGGTTETETETEPGTGMSPTETETDTETEMSPTETETETETVEDTETETATETESGDGMLRVAHLSPDAPNVDVAVDGDTVLSDVAFGTVSEYLSLSPDEYQITITPTGGEQAVFDQTVSVESGLQTAAAIGEVSGENQSFEVTLFTGDDALAESGSARVRAVHAIPDAPTVDVTAGEAVIADALEYGAVSEYVTAPATTTQVELRPESDANDADPVGTFDVELADRAVHTVFAAGYLEASDDQPSATVVVATDAAPEATETETETETVTGTENETMG